MYNCVELNFRNINEFRLLSEFNYEFNKLNKDFFAIYDESNLIKKYFLRKEVKLLRYNSQYIGYIWAERINEFCSYINSMNVLVENNLYSSYEYLLKTLRKKQILKYYCEVNNINYNILIDLGFEIRDGIIELERNVKDIIQYEENQHIRFHTLIRDKDEEIRCRIQNEIFEKEGRIPLDVDDIFYEEEQDYYFDEGAIFIMKDSEVVGYGQIILEDKTPFIVNFGIIFKYRGQGYGKKLMQYLIQISKENKFETLFIKVDMDNQAALKLYETMGFKVSKKYYNMEFRLQK